MLAGQKIPHSRNELGSRFFEACTDETPHESWQGKVTMVSKHVWTHSEDQLLQRLFSGNRRIWEIAFKLGLTVDQIEARLEELRLIKTRKSEDEAISTGEHSSRNKVKASIDARNYERRTRFNAIDADDLKYGAIKLYDRYSGLLNVEGVKKEIEFAAHNIRNRENKRLTHQLEPGFPVIVHLVDDEASMIWPINEIPDDIMKKIVELNTKKLKVNNLGSKRAEFNVESPSIVSSLLHGITKLYRSTTEDKLSGNKNISSDSILDDWLDSVGITAEKRAPLIERIKKLVKNTSRTLWDDRMSFENLSHLTAPRFMRAVYPDAFDAGGRLIDEDIIRLSDPRLVQAVQGYINQRVERALPLGDAEGIEFSKKDGRGRPKKAPRLGSQIASKGLT